MMIVDRWIQLALVLVAVIEKRAIVRSSFDSCSAGSFTNSTGGCESCPAGQYQPESAQTSCIKCPKGTEQSLTGQTKSSSCRPCKVGWMATDQGSKFCSECPPGTFTNVTRTKDCYKCEPGTHNNSTGKGECELCPPGTYQDESEETNCKPCPDGRYIDQWGAVSCKTCSGTISVDNTTCYVCPEMSAPSNGMGYYSANPPPRHPGNVYIQSCISSYVGRGPAERRCQNNGSWSGSPFSCHRKCPKIGEPVNGSVMYSTQPPLEDSTAEFRCYDGASLVGERSAQCQANGTWNITDTPKCVPTDSKRHEECGERMCAFEGKCFHCSGSFKEKCFDENNGFIRGVTGFCNMCTYQCKDNSYLFSVAGVSITMEILTIFCGSFLFLLSFCIFLSCWRYKKRRNKISSFKIKHNSSPSKSQLIITIRSHKLEHLPIDLDF